MRFELTKKFISTLKKIIHISDIAALSQKMFGKHSADIAEIMKELSFDEALALYKQLDEKKAAEVLVKLDEDLREKILASLTTKDIATKYIDNLSSDDAADVISELPDQLQDEVLKHIETEDAGQARDIVDLMNYEEGTAGALMAKELIQVNWNDTVWECVREMRRQAETVQNVYVVYVVDEEHKLKGILPLKKLLTTPLRTKIMEVCNPDVISVKTNAASEEVSQIMEKYDFVVLPVVDGLGKLVGRITIDDVVDVMREEAGKDYQLMSGITQNIEVDDKVWVISRARLPWLLVAMLGGVVGSELIGKYEGQIQIHPEMAFFMPLIAAMGGNVGVQSSALIVQGLANQTIGTSGIFSKLLKELSVGLFNGIICSVLLLSYNLLFSDTLALSLTVSIALLSVILFAAIFGTFVPLILNKYKIDPALATGPFITTSNDIIGISIYFTIGRLMYGMF